jgi:predicted phosphoadenosine phosphosulfate sulfurtransferase
MARIYRQKNVLEAAQERVSRLFDMYEQVSVSVSGGKDSSVIFHLAYKEAVKRKRNLMVAFIDQEAEYRATIDVVRAISQLPSVEMSWFQVPFLMTNSVSYEQDYLHCWDGNQQRAYEPCSIRHFEGGKNLTWEKLLKALEKRFTAPTAQILGLRSAESLNRYRAVTKNAAIEGMSWSSRTSSEKLINFYPIYDWGFSDVWRYIFDENIAYNRIYDYQFAKDYNKEEMRISCLIHEKSYRCLADLPEFEPDTFEWLCRRCKGIDTAMRYAKEKQMYSNEKLPSGYQSWEQFRNFLLDSHPNKKQRERFINRFKNQPQNEMVYKQQVGQLLINDWENITDVKTDQMKRREELKKKYMEIL